MAPIRKNTAKVVEIPHVWKSGGPEQRELNRLFENGTIDSTDTPASVRRSVPMFQEFQPKTFATHFRMTKAKYGLYASNKTNAKYNPRPNATNEEEDENIPELCGATDGSRTRSPSVFVNIVDSIEARNYPYITWTYTDHDAKHDVVCVAVPTVTGSRDITFVLSDDGMTLTVKYTWPSALLKPHQLLREFRLENGDRLPVEHPAFYSLQNRLSDADLSDKSKPEASFVIPLPMRVQREVGSYHKQAITCDETKLVMVKCTAYQKNKVLEDADTSIRF